MQQRRILFLDLIDAGENFRAVGNLRGILQHGSELERKIKRHCRKRHDRKGYTTANYKYSPLIYLARSIVGPGYT